MSIYSGLATRQDQTCYNKLLLRLISTMQQHILQLCNGIIAPHFSNKYSKLIAKMQFYQEHKYLPPKFSTVLKPLQQAMRNTLMSKNKNQGLLQFNFKLEAVKEQQDEVNSPRQLNKYKTQLYMKKSIIRNKKLFQKEQKLTQPDSNQKDKNTRSRSVFSQKKPKLQTQLKNVEKFKGRQTFGQFNYKRGDVISSSESRIKNKKMLLQINQKSPQDTSNKLMKALSEAVNKRV